MASNLSGHVKRLTLRALYDKVTRGKDLYEVTTTGITLATVLAQFATARWNDIQDGRLIELTSGGGEVTRIGRAATSDIGGLSQESMASLGDELLTLNTAVVSWLNWCATYGLATTSLTAKASWIDQCAPGVVINPSPTAPSDATVFTCMLASITANKTARSTFELLRQPFGFPW